MQPQLFIHLLQAYARFELLVLHLLALEEIELSFVPLSLLEQLGPLEVLDLGARRFLHIEQHKLLVARRTAFFFICLVLLS